ncbi:ABC transporter F family member 4 [Carex littledalei]|uniref:ABC transporter F family member 4 n=1 Tax=Carex littledalei TaxID=544730 RepID=A0A833VHW9_9POAL|nr:ABC transporter F family member 4 [Carex littledalei]
MADRAEKAVGKVNKEGSDGDSDDNVPIYAINKGKKKVEDSDDDEVPLAVSRAKKKSAESKKVGGKGNAMPSQVKKEEDSKEGLEKKKGENKKENSKGKEKQNKKSSSDKVKRERVKKVYDLPGQKHDPPEERDPLRIFYESLYHQVPDSEMAAIWMMEWGLLPEDEAKKVFQKKKLNGISSPAKPLSASKSPAANASVKRSLSSTKNTKDNSAKSKKRKAGSDAEDSSDDFLALSKPNPKKKQRVSN